ncbi:hypothetical protein HY626_02065 [Candidatus Uhrbacteria bacterium]|nr:hypothetical protein [Candidatus Uhrbacteria bacterium]
MNCYECRLTRDCQKPQKHISLCEDFAPTCCDVLMQKSVVLKRIRFRCGVCKQRFSLPLPIRLMEIFTHLRMLPPK